MSEPIRENNVLASTITTPEDLERLLLAPMFERPREAYFLVVPVDGYDPDVSSPEDLRPGRDALPAILQEALDQRLIIDGCGEWTLFDAETGHCWPQLGWAKRGRLTLPNYHPDYVTPGMASRAMKAIEARRTHFRWRVLLTTSEHTGRVALAEAKALGAVQPEQGVPAAAPRSYKTAKAIATENRVPEEDLQRRLYRLREKTHDPEIWQEIADRARGKPKYLFNENSPDVQKHVHELQEKAKAP